ncbi:MAG: vWA domain-containing protein, partial [Terrimicrobiaceae bacterium]
MSFLYPAALFLGLLAPVIVALYLRRPRRSEREVSTLMFWQKVLERQPNRQFLGRLRNPFSLLLQLLILLLLVLALARPEPSRPRGGQSSVIVLDARARMQADDGKVFRAAVNAAMNLVARAGPDNEVALLSSEGSSQIVSSFSTDGKDLRGRLEALAPSDGGGDLEQTLALARRLLAGAPGEKRLVVITDRPLPSAPDLEEILVGTPGDNAAILAFAQRALPASPQSAVVFAKLGNFSAASRDLELELSLDGRPFDLRKFRVAAGAEVDFSTVVPGEMLRSGRGFLTARLLSRDGLAADDTARLALSTGQGLRVLLVTDGNPFLEGALKADPALAVEILRPSAWRSGMGKDFAAVIFDQWVPADSATESGAFFFFGRSPFDAEGEKQPVLQMELTDPQSPLFWNVDVSAFRLGTVTKLDVPGGWRVSRPLENAGEPLVLALEKPDGTRIIATGFDTGSTNFPLRAGFPLFVSNAVHWLAGRGSAGESGLSAGKTYVPAEGEKISLRPESEKETAKLAGEAPSLTEAP